MQWTHAVILASQNRGKVPLESSDATWTQRVSCHMNGGQLDGAMLKVEPRSSDPSLSVCSFTSSPHPLWTWRRKHKFLFTFALSFSVTFALLVSITVPFPTLWQEAQCL